VLADGTEVEILNVIDDYSRLCVGADARWVTDTHAVLETFEAARLTWGSPASMLTDNAAIFSARFRKGRTVFESELERLGIVYKNARPYHPQTCGKVERFPQTMKKFFAKRRPVRTLGGLQGQIDAFVAHYNTARPHRARHDLTPLEAFSARTGPSPDRRSRRRTFGCAPTGSTATATSLCAITRGYCTSAWAARTKASASTSTSTISTCASSPSKASYSGTSPSTQRGATKGAIERSSSLPGVRPSAMTCEALGDRDSGTPY
jgi:hypothetical protein